MVQSVSNQLSQAVYGFEASSRFDASASKRAGAGSRSENSGDSSASKKSEASTVTQLTPEEERIVKELKRTDIRVREHEQAHVAGGADFKLRPQIQQISRNTGQCVHAGGEGHA